MTENSGSSPTPSRPGSKVKSLVAQGMIGAVSLTGATAIPLIVQRFLTPPTPVVAPAQVQPNAASQVPSDTTNQIQPVVQESQEDNVQVADQENEPPGHRRKDEREDKRPKD
jgi:hypothetical protein